MSVVDVPGAVVTPLSESRYMFQCPGCGCAHWFDTSGGQWSWDGDVVKPTVSPSILVRSRDANGGAICHSFVKTGRIQFLNDCTHALKGQTVELEPWDGGG